ncbi:agouti-related protein [Dunckerocampus dactyliophorus]|uniref:agouti-related protein n=1 Tax=Dunckerocampus dactyliophorus TaxID=161453 RepID=UPI002404995C|nr:agouti-related protein [Dunckerocampus dactyliophorus]
MAVMPWSERDVEESRTQLDGKTVENHLSSDCRMSRSLLLCCWTLSLLTLSSTLVHQNHQNLQVDNDLAAPSHPDSSYLSEMERGHAPALLPVDSVEDHFLMESGSYDEDSAVAAAAAAALQQQGRAMRSPRRCIPHQQSCLGYPLPCCDPCDTCYCRFFNAICYCRRVGHACPPRRT